MMIDKPSLNLKNPITQITQHRNENNVSHFSLAPLRPTHNTCLTRQTQKHLRLNLTKTLGPSCNEPNCTPKGKYSTYCHHSPFRNSIQH
uniref:Uncharacterized protein n=1 Tax=Rhizophora mucronata TaxID=61149 RepID=A0A2P2NR82_RHIMU